MIEIIYFCICTMHRFFWVRVIYSIAIGLKLFWYSDGKFEASTYLLSYHKGPLHFSRLMLWARKFHKKRSEPSKSRNSRAFYLLYQNGPITPWSIIIPPKIKVIRPCRDPQIYALDKFFAQKMLAVWINAANISLAT